MDTKCFQRPGAQGKQRPVRRDARLRRVSILLKHHGREPAQLQRLPFQGARRPYRFRRMHGGLAQLIVRHTSQMNSIHHVTAIAGKAARNLEFYTNTLGLRLVKKTVNFDDPGTYHFYFGDSAGNPGTLLTFFPWDMAAPGHPGAGQIEETAFRVPEESLGFWTHRFLERAVKHAQVTERFGRKIIRFEDFDGMKLALVATPKLHSSNAWAVNGVTSESAIQGIDSVTMIVEDPGPSAALLTDVFGYAEHESENEICRYAVEGSESHGATVLLRTAQELFNGRFGRGSVHHVAFRAKDDEEQMSLAEKLRANHSVVTTPQKNRDYFRSIYFREPGGIIFEIATDGPGFAIDEPQESLGSELKLPAFLEGRRGEIEQSLPELT